MTDQEDAAGDADEPPDADGSGGRADDADGSGGRSDAADTDRAEADRTAAGAGDSAADGERAAAEARTDAPRQVDASGEDDDSGGFLSNLTSPRKQLGDAAAAFKNARGSGNLPTDEADRVKLVCRRHAERRAVPLDDLGRPACFEEGHPDCEGCLEDVRDGVVETW